VFGVGVRLWLVELNMVVIWVGASVKSLAYGDENCLKQGIRQGVQNTYIHTYISKQLSRVESISVIKHQKRNVKTIVDQIL
jgi:hypothetical protein